MKEQGEWLQVSPSKVSRSPSKGAEVEESTLVSASKYAVLSMDEEEEGEIFENVGNNVKNSATEEANDVETKFVEETETNDKPNATRTHSRKKKDVTVTSNQATKNSVPKVAGKKSHRKAY